MACTAPSRLKTQRGDARRLHSNLHLQVNLYHVGSIHVCLWFGLDKINTENDTTHRTW